MHEDVLDDFLAESMEHLERSEQDLLELERIENDSEQTFETLNRLFRGVHSIKGAAGFLELVPIVEVTHAMENIFGTLRERREVPDAECADLMLNGLDTLRQMLDNINNPESFDTRELLGSLHKHETKLKGKSSLSEHDAIPESSATHPPFEPENGCFCYRIECSNLFEAEKELAGVAEVKARTENKLLATSVLEADLVHIAIGQKNTKVTPVTPEDFAKELTACNTAPAGDKTQKNERASSAQTNSKTSGAPGTKLPARSGTSILPRKDNSVRVDLELLEQLMALAGELVLVRNRHLCWLSGVSGHPKYESGREVAQRMDAVTTELQTAIMKTRMQPLDRVFGKLTRLVREVARQLDKEIELRISGADEEVDRAILESLADPLTHLLRNSCDHGIETPRERQAAGKPAQGIVSVSASHESGHIRIEIEDDGKGIDPDAIARKTIEKGLVSEQETQSMDTRRKLSLIMLPGFSTAQTVSNISGRGVGMDVVKSSVEKLSGTIEIDSTPGRGSKFILRLPLTLAIIQSLVVMENSQRYLIPRINLEEVINLVGEEIGERVHIAAGQEVMEYHKSLLQLVRLGDVLGQPTPFTSEDRARVAAKHKDAPENANSAGSIPTLDVAVVRVGEHRYGLVVEETLEMEEIVVKPLHPAQENLKIFLGVTVTGDGRIAPILDVEGVARHALDEIRYSVRRGEENRFISRSDESQKILLFENAPGEQFAIGLSFIRRIASITQDELETIGDRLYANVGGKSVLVARLENALRVKPSPENEEMYLIMPRYGQSGCAILASRILGISAVITDFSDEESPTEEGLLGTAIVGGTTTLFPDIYHICETALASPASQEESQTVSDTYNTNLKYKSSGQQQRVLLVEDAAFFRQLIMTYLKRENLQVDTAPDGTKAWEALQSAEYDLVLSDIEMPIMDGRELVRHIRSDDKFNELPVIALTSLDTPEDREECITAGFNEYNIKLNREQLLGTIRQYLEPCPV